MHCDIWKNKGKEDVPTLEEWKTVLSDLRRWLGRVQVTFSGGEALLRKDTAEIRVRRKEGCFNQRGMGDGIADAFMATRATWWFSSRGTGPWTFLRASTKRLSEVELGDLDGDHRCDVKVGNTVYSGGTMVLTHPPIIGGGVLGH